MASAANLTYSLPAGVRRVGLGRAVAPGWVETAIAAGWAVGEWLAVSGASPTPGYGLTATNTLHATNTAGDSVSTLNEALFDSWVGAALCQGHRAFGTYLMGPGGSHNNYGRGTTYLWDVETRAWEEVAGEDTSGLKSATEPVDHFGEYVSGRPATNHNAWWAFYDSHRNEFCYPRGWGSPTSGSDQFPAPFGHGLDLAGYDASGYSDALWRRYPELTGLTANQLNLGLSQQCGCVWDETRKSVWVAAASNSFSDSGVLARYDSVADAWTMHVPQWSVYLGSSYSLDPVRDVLLAGTVAGGGSIVAVDLANPDARFSGTAPSQALWSVTNTGAPPAAFTRAGFDWSPSLDGIVYYRQNDSATEVKLGRYASGGTFTPGVQTDYTLNWSSLLSLSNAVSPPAIGASGGAYSKFRLARWGAREVAFFVADADGPMYAFRVH